MGLMDNIRNLFKKENNEPQMANSYLDLQLKQFTGTLLKLNEQCKQTKSPELNKLYNKGIEFQQIINECQKNLKQIKDPECFKLKSQVVAEMALYAKSYLTDADKQRWLYCFDQRLKQVEFVRPENEQDMEYRNNLKENFFNKLNKIVPDTSELLFHSTSASFAKSIIESKSLSSSADRYDGYNASTDGFGRISVTDISQLDWIAPTWLKISNTIMPCGVMFVVKEKTPGEYDSVQKQMNSIDFEKNPEQLVAVVSSPENMKMLDDVMFKAGLNPNIVHTFEEFLQLQKEKYIEIPNRVVLTEEMKETMEQQEEAKYIDHDKIIEEHEQYEQETTIEYNKHDNCR